MYCGRIFSQVRRDFTRSMTFSIICCALARWSDVEFAGSWDAIVDFIWLYIWSMVASDFVSTRMRSILASLVSSWDTAVPRSAAAKQSINIVLAFIFIKLPHLACE